MVGRMNAFARFFRTLGFILSAQAKELVQVPSTLSLVGRMLYVGLLLLYALGMGMLFHYTDRLNTTPEKILTGLNFALAVMTIAKGYFPAYQTTSQPIISFYPFRRIEKALLGICVDAISLYTASILVFYGIAFSLAHSVLTPAQMLMSVIFFCTVMLLDRSFRFVVEYAIGNSVITRVCVGISVFCLAGLLLGQRFMTQIFQDFTVIPNEWLTLGIFGIALVVQVLLALHVVQPRIESSAGASLHKGRINTHSGSEALYSLKAFFTTKHIAQMLGMAFLLKLGMLFFLAKADLSGFQVGQGRFHFNWMYAAPIVWFTYALNNSFGMNWHVWQTRQLHASSLKATLTQYFRQTFIILSLDAVLTSAALFYRGLFQIDFIVLWFSTAASLLVLGLVISITYSIKVERLTSSIFVSLRHVSSTQGIFSVMFVLLVNGIIASFQVWFVVLIPISLCIGAAYTLRHFSTMKYRLYNGIHK